MFRRKDFFRDHTEQIETLAQTRTHRFGIYLQLISNFGVTQVAIITQLNDFTTVVVQLIEALADEARGLRIGQQGVGAGSPRGQLDLFTFVPAVEREMDEATAAFLGATFPAEIHRLVRGDAEQPGLK